MAMTQVIVESEVKYNRNVFVLKFRFPEKEVETPSFMIDVKRSKSYTKWNIFMMDDFETENLAETKKLLQEAIKSPKFEIVLGECENSEIDGELFSKLIQLTMWVETITCDNPEFIISDEKISAYNPGVREVSISMA